MEIHKMIATVRLYLDEPNPQHPTQRHIWEVLMAHLQNYYNELQNSGQNWAVNEYQLDVIKDQNEYTLNIGIGKPIFILTRYDDPSIHDREIPIVDIQNWDYPSAGGTGGRWVINAEPFSASAIAFYGKDGVSKCRIMPTPEGPASYTIWYTPALEGSDALANTPLMPEHHYLLISRTALTCIPYCRWGDNLDPQLMMAKASSITNSIGFLNQQQEDSFYRYRSNLRREQMSPRVMYGQYADW
jgi:hypothetical protein